MTESSQQVDKRQRKILYKTALKIDWRGSTNPFTAMHGKKGKFPGIVAVMFINIFFSFMLSMLFRIAPSFFLGLVLASTGGMIIIGIQLLIEYSHIIISPDDYHVISPLPVNSKTYFQAKLMHLFSYVSILSLSVSFFPAVIAAFVFESFIIFPVVLIQFALVNYFTAFIIMNFYTFAMKIINRRKVERVLLYLQFAFVTSFYLGMQIIPKLLGEYFKGSSSETLLWVKFLPAYALSSWYLLIQDGWDAVVFSYFIVAVIVLLGLFKISTSFLSLSYAESLAKIDNEKKKQKFLTPTFILLLWNKISSIEERIILKLFWSEFKHNTRFKMQLLTILPLFVYGLYATYTNNESIVDPFNIIETSKDTAIFMPMLMSFIPFTLMMAIQYSKSWKASSVFFYTSCDKTKIMLAAKKNIMFLFLLPLSVLLIFMYGYYFDNYFHASLYMVFVFSNLMLAVNIMSLFSIRVPFSADMATAGKFTLEGFIVMMTVPLILIPIIIVNSIGFSGVLSWSLITTTIFLINYAVWKFSIVRIKNKIEKNEFLG